MLKLLTLYLIFNANKSALLVADINCKRDIITNLYIGDSVLRWPKSLKYLAVTFAFVSYIDLRMRSVCGAVNSVLSYVI